MREESYNLRERKEELGREKKTLDPL